MEDQTNPTVGADVKPSASNNKKPASNLKKGGMRHGWKLCLVILLIVLGLVWWHGSMSNPQGSVNTKEYQAVFLTNGQVYFGKLASFNGGYLKLTDIYYLQVQQSVQPAGSGNGNTATSSTTSSSSSGNAQLVKLGNELHGPEDQMYVARDQVLFWENLKTNGKVSQAISQYQATNK